MAQSGNADSGKGRKSTSDPALKKPASKRHKRQEVDTSHYTQADIRRILLAYKGARDSGLTVEESADSIKVARSTLYRWIERDKKRKEVQVAEKISSMSVDQAIRILTTAQGFSKLEKVEALCYFISWLRWPTKTTEHDLMAMTCVTAYLNQAFDACLVSELPTEARDFIAKYIRLDILARACSPDYLDFPYFENFPIDNQPYDDRDVLADICWFILAFGKSQTDARKSASLNKAFYLLQRGAFRYFWAVSRKTQSLFWKEHSAAAPFAYIERFHPGPYLSLVPSSEGFASEIDEILSHPDALLTYFRRCNWAVQTLVTQLDPRALHSTIFPSFPDDLGSEPVNPPKLPSRIRIIVSEFHRA